ncbi:TIGR03086 family metal-binding protein [Streptomyces sp. NBC_01506]|uniref:TIGR03086 family metal-binding protein n=1 Tax=Streptomyces sp. NBC_01506 TaxID=2903887 RepID=UPI0038634D96
MDHNQRFKNELDTLIDRHLLPEDREREAVWAYDRAVILETVRILEHAEPADWARPTPCADWDLSALVSHMAGRHRGFAAAAAGGGADRRLWQPLPLGDDPLGAYRATVALVVESLAQPGVRERQFDLAEISTTRPYPATVAVGFHFLDYTVHAWDVARALGLDWEPADDIAAAALAIALRVPDDERRLAPGAPFRPARTPAGDGRPFARVLTTLGRSPAWTAVDPQAAEWSA